MNLARPQLFPSAGLARPDGKLQLKCCNGAASCFRRSLSLILKVLATSFTNMAFLRR